MPQSSAARSSAAKASSFSMKAVVVGIAFVVCLMAFTFGGTGNEASDAPPQTDVTPTSASQTDVTPTSASQTTGLPTHTKSLATQTAVAAGEFLAEFSFVGLLVYLVYLVYRGHLAVSEAADKLSETSTQEPVATTNETSTQELIATTKSKRTEDDEKFVLPPRCCRCIL